jgi:hypothetical protein
VQHNVVVVAVNLANGTAMTTAARLVHRRGAHHVLGAMIQGNQTEELFREA